MGLKVRDTITGEERVLLVTGVFVAIGHEPNTTLVTRQVDLRERLRANGSRLVHQHRRPLRRRRRPQLKENAVYVAAYSLAIDDNNKDYPALIIANSFWGKVV